jgi:hypothetical protein
MWTVAPGHAAGLTAALIALPLALLLIRLHPARRQAPGTVRAAAVLMAMSGAIHLALVPHLTAEPVTASLFLIDGSALIVLAALFPWRWWRTVSATLLIAALLGYVVYIVAGLEGPDQVGLATKLLEVTALGLLLVPVRGESGRLRLGLRWAALVGSVPLLTLVTGTSAWGVSLARPDPGHVHPGALLQATNPIATPAHREAADSLYAETKAAITPYQDWHAAWAAGYRPEGSTAMPSTHWLNQAYVKAGYVMDPGRPQGLVYANTRRGPVLLGAMFQMPRIGQFGPDPGGPLTAWHQHENICFTPFGFAFSLMTPYATCPLGAINLSAAPMLHVWIVENPGGGRFAVDIDKSVVDALRRS